MLFLCKNLFIEVKTGSSKLFLYCIFYRGVAMKNSPEVWVLSVTNVWFSNCLLDTLGIFVYHFYIYVCVYSCVQAVKTIETFEGV